MCLLVKQYFNQEIIPHSETIFCNETICNCINDYDAFITGSDQVWNLRWSNFVFLLGFVPSDKVKISYAASIARDSLTSEQKKIFEEGLKDYQAISVREQSAVALLEGLSPVDIQITLDPTLLLTQEDWDKICAERVIKEDYCFCYFLGNNKKGRKIAQTFANKHNLKLIMIPHATGSSISVQDLAMRGQKLYDVSPQQFLSLIKYAKYVFTDSFHAVVFSNIYQKQYFVFRREKNDVSSSRIIDITHLFHQKVRFCSDNKKENLQYLNSLKDIDYTQANPTFERLRQESIEFLKRNLGDTEE